MIWLSVFTFFPFHFYSNGNYWNDRPFFQKITRRFIHRFIENLFRFYSGLLLLLVCALEIRIEWIKSMFSHFINTNEAMIYPLNFFWCADNYLNATLKFMNTNKKQQQQLAYSDDWWSSAPIASIIAYSCARVCFCMYARKLLYSLLHIHMSEWLFAKVMIITAPIITFHPVYGYCVTKKCQHLINAFTWGRAMRTKVVHNQQQYQHKLRDSDVWPN